MQPVSISPVQFNRYLAANGIAPGELAERLALGDTPSIRYFVIHDTSSPETDPPGSPFPSTIDRPDWRRPLAHTGLEIQH